MEFLASCVVFAVIPCVFFGLIPLVKSRRLEKSDEGRARRSAAECDRLTHDLRRLDAEYGKVLNSDMPAKAARLRALSLAYDETLRCCCVEVGLPKPGEVPLSGFTRIETEAALVQHGLGLVASRVLNVLGREGRCATSPAGASVVSSRALPRPPVGRLLTGRLLDIDRRIRSGVQLDFVPGVLSYFISRLGFGAGFQCAGGAEHCFGKFGTGRYTCGRRRGPREDRAPVQRCGDRLHVLVDRRG